jgi:CPA2 family monovalent cation:H+ antiporter-2
MNNLNDREITKAKITRSDLIPWDEHMAFFDIAPSSNVAGKTPRNCSSANNSVSISRSSVVAK